VTSSYKKTRNFTPNDRLYFSLTLTTNQMAIMELILPPNVRNTGENGKTKPGESREGGGEGINRTANHPLYHLFGNRERGGKTAVFYLSITSSKIVIL
jgi:hypothetical protein